MCDTLRACGCLLLALLHAYQGRGALQITEEEQQCAKGLILAGCAKLFTHCEVGNEGIDLVLAHHSGMSQVRYRRHLATATITSAARQRKAAGEVDSDEMPRSGHADFLAWHQASLIRRTAFLCGSAYKSPSTPCWPYKSGRQAAGTCEIACDERHFQAGRSHDELEVLSATVWVLIRQAVKVALP